MPTHRLIPLLAETPQLQRRSNDMNKKVSIALALLSLTSCYAALTANRNRVAETQDVDFSRAHLIISTTTEPRHPRCPLALC
jgi:hypothetical protein